MQPTAVSLSPNLWIPLKILLFLSNQIPGKWRKPKLVMELFLCNENGGSRSTTSLIERDSFTSLQNIENPKNSLIRHQWICFSIYGTGIHKLILLLITFRNIDYDHEKSWDVVGASSMIFSCFSLGFDFEGFCNYHLNKILYSWGSFLQWEAHFL